MDDFLSDEEVDSLCERLKLTKLENEEILIDLKSVQKVITRGKNCLLIKLLLVKYYNRKTFKATRKKVWCPTKAMKFVEMERDMMMAKF